MSDGAVLGFDFGSRRIGVAIGNRLTGHARPLTTIDAVGTEARWKALGAVIDEWQPVASRSESRCTRTARHTQ